MSALPHRRAQEATELLRAAGWTVSEPSFNARNVQPFIYQPAELDCMLTAKKDPEALFLIFHDDEALQYLYRVNGQISAEYLPCRFRDMPVRDFIEDFLGH